MAASRDESKAVTPFMPSLFHLAAVKIAVPLFEEFGAETMKEALADIQHGNLTTSEGKTEESRKMNRAKEKLLDIPAHLRQRVIEAVHGSHHVFNHWTWFYTHVFRFQLEDCRFHWRSDGSIDATKTALNQIQNPELDIFERFDLASVFCLPDSVEALRPEMLKSGAAKSGRKYVEGVVAFWVEWLRDRTRAPWTRSLGISNPRFRYILDAPPSRLPRLSALFPHLGPAERRGCQHLLHRVSSDDFRFCLNSISKEEEEHMLLKEGAYRLLSLHLEWPLQTLFLETAAKLWDHIGHHCFKNLVAKIMDLNEFNLNKDFNYAELFEIFWNASPTRLKECVRKWPYLEQRIESYFSEKRKKRKIC